MPLSKNLQQHQDNKEEERERFKEETRCLASGGSESAYYIEYVFQSWFEPRHEPILSHHFEEAWPIRAVF